MYWAIIVTECFRKDDTKAPRSSAQIWINFQTGADSSSKIYYRKNEFDYDTVDFRWGEFKEILSDAHLVTITNNITELQTNIKTNANDIDKLEISKANRADISYSELDAFNVASGIYYTNGDGKEILGFSANAWTVIVADSILGGNSQSQIWINVSSNSIQHMYIRRQQTSTEGETIWSEFTEVITTNTLTLEDIAKAKQYKGYYATLANLQTAYTAANAGDYAIVGETQGFYMWDAVLKQWTSVASASNGGESGAVTSVNGQTGDVLLTKANFGLDKVENTPDLEKNVYSAQMLAEAKMIDGIDFNGTTNIVHYGTCNTDAAEEDKIVQCTGFNLVVGAWIAITFTETNSANIENLTLNVNSTGAKPIKSGSKSLILSEDLIENTTYLFVYDGTNYQIVNGKASDKLEIVKQNNNTLDADYIYRLCMAGKKFALVPKPFYHYVKRKSSSLTGDKISERLFSLQQWGHKAYEEVLSRGPEYIDAAERILYNSLVHILRNFMRDYKNGALEQGEYKAEIQSVVNDIINLLLRAQNVSKFRKLNEVLDIINELLEANVLDKDGGAKAGGIVGYLTAQNNAHVNKICTL